MQLPAFNVAFGSSDSSFFPLPALRVELERHSDCPSKTCEIPNNLVMKVQVSLYFFCWKVFIVCIPPSATRAMLDFAAKAEARSPGLAENLGVAMQDVKMKMVRMRAAQIAMEDGDSLPMEEFLRSQADDMKEAREKKAAEEAESNIS